MRGAPPGAAGGAGSRTDGFAAVDALLEAFLARGAFPGGVLAVGRSDRLLHIRALGRLSFDAGSPEARPDTLYDLASLTKVVLTTTLAMILVEEGRLSLLAPVGSYVQGFQGEGRERVLVEHLLTHASGLPAWAPLYREARGPEAFLERIQALRLEREPGTRSVYSDLGVILLGAVLERASGEAFETLARRRVLAPLGMDETLFRPPAEALPRVAPTEQDPFRGRLIHGEVHDENAWAMGGVAPHAGLFGTAPDLARFARMLAGGGRLTDVRIVSAETLRRFTTRAGVPGSSRALGWDTPSEGSSAGRLLSPCSFGHTGFTGTSLWVDPARDVFVLLLTNRIHPTRENTLIGAVRPAVADAVVRALEGGEVG